MKVKFRSPSAMEILQPCAQELAAIDAMFRHDFERADALWQDLFSRGAGCCIRAESCAKDAGYARGMDMYGIMVHEKVGLIKPQKPVSSSRQRDDMTKCPTFDKSSGPVFNDKFEDASAREDDNQKAGSFVRRRRLHGQTYERLV